MKYFMKINGQSKYGVIHKEFCRKMSFLRDLYFFQGQKYTSFGKNILLRQSTSLGHSSTGHPASGQLWKPVTDAFFEVFLMFLGSFDCQLWAIFHFGTLYA